VNHQKCATVGAILRRKAWKKPAPRYNRGVLAKYASAVTSASLVALTDMDLEL